jgi:CSLREA domain-containing protein
VHRGAVLALLTLAGVSLGQQPVRAATITVNSTADNTTAGDDHCTLREAIANVNAGDDTTGGDCTAGTGSGDTIVFNLTLPATITLTTNTELEIDTGVTINGPTTGVLAVDGNGQVDVFDITNGTVSIANLTIQNGLGSDGGGIYNDARLTLTSCTLSGNSGDDGGGVYNDIGGTATLTNCTLSGNSAPDDHGGGGVYSDGALTLSGCTLNGNSGVDGGGVYNDVSGTAMLTNCTLSANSASDDVGGGGVYSDGTVALTNCTLNGNSAPTSNGGGLYNDSDGTLTVTNTIVANSPSGGNCAGFGGVTDGGHNLDSDGTCGVGPATNPMLDPAGLANNGGPTQTIALQAGSPAVNAGDESVCSAPPVNNLDQRGYVRPGAGATSCSIGAYEYNAVPASPTPCVGDCNGDGTVTVDDILTMVNITLGNTSVTTCEAGDANHDGQITVDEILTAVNNALNGC